MTDFKVGDKVRLTGDKYPDDMLGEVVQIKNLHWWAGWTGLHAASERYWTVGCPGYDGVVVERDGRVIPEALLPGDVVAHPRRTRDLTVRSITGRSVKYADGTNSRLDGDFLGRCSFVRPATPKPADQEIVVHRNGAVIGAPPYGEAVREVLGRMSDDAKERMAIGRATRSAYDEALALLTAVPDYDSPLATTITVDSGPPVADDAVAYGGREYTLPRATSIADAALRGLPYEVDLREEERAVDARFDEWFQRRGDPLTDLVQHPKEWAAAKAADLRESLESEARRTLREWPTRAGVPLRLVVRGDAGLFTATWEE